MHETIVANELFQPGERVAVAASGASPAALFAHLNQQAAQLICSVCTALEALRTWKRSAVAALLAVLHCVDISVAKHVLNRTGEARGAK